MMSVPEPTDRPASRITRLQIEGMHCAACVNRLEKIIGRQPGVLGATVNLVTESALVEHTGEWHPTDTLAAIRKAGFDAHPAATVAAPSALKPTDAAAALAAHAKTTESPDHAPHPAKPAGGSTDRDGIITIASLLIAAGLMWPMVTGQSDWPAWLQFAVATPVQWGAGWLFLRGAWGAVRTRAANMDVLVALGSLTAWSWSTAVWLTAEFGQLTELLLGNRHGMPPGSTALADGLRDHLFFEAAVSIIAFVRLGKWLERRTRAQTAAALNGLARLRPDTVEWIKEAADGNLAAWAQPDAPVSDRPVTDVRPGDCIRILPARRIPCDAEVVWGLSHVDESALTGESLPVSRQTGEPLRAGTLNQDGVLIARVTATGDQTVLGQVIQLIERAQGHRLPVQSLVDQIAAVFVPLVLLVAAGTGAWLLGIDGSGLEAALMRAVTVVVVACPCALGLATPAAILAGTGAAARAGLLIRDPRALHTARHIDTVVFDKTGTLTAGQPVLTHITLNPDRPLDASRVLALASGLQTKGAHPLAHALRESLVERGLHAARFETVRLLPGIGSEGLTADGWRSRIAPIHHARSLLELSDQATLDVHVEHPNNAGKTVSVLLSGPADTTRWQWDALLAFEDRLRPETPAALAALKARGLTMVVLSGDRQTVVDTVTRGLGLARALGELSPAEKADILQAYKREGRHIAMVGDGVNDAPAMAIADLAMAMGGGTDIAAQTAHVTLMNNRLTGVEATLDISRRIHRNIAENLFWAFAYNTLCIPLAVTGHFNPAFAAAAMAFSSVSVVANALRLSRWQPQSPCATHHAMS